MWAILIAGVLSLLSSCNFFYAVNGTGHTEAAILYQKDSLFTIKNFPLVFQCRFDENQIRAFNNKQPSALILENPKIISAPDGVYELYISGLPLESNSLSASSNSFATTLDFYSVTAPEAKNKIEAAITKQLNQLFLQKNNPKFLYITIKFGAIKMADGNYSTNAGSFSFSGIKILQPK